MESIITSAKRNVKFREGDERSAGSFSQKDAGDLGEKNIITAGEQNVKSEEVDEKPEGGFSQKDAGALGVEIIITSAKRIVKFREGDESSGGLLAESYRNPGHGEYHHFSKENCKIRRGR